MNGEDKLLRRVYEEIGRLRENVSGLSREVMLLGSLVAEAMKSPADGQRLLEARVDRGDSPPAKKDAAELDIF
jgi:hypothetical protein